MVIALAVTSLITLLLLCGAVVFLVFKVKQLTDLTGGVGPLTAKEQKKAVV